MSETGEVHSGGVGEGAEFRRRRKALRLSQRQLGAMAGEITDTTVRKLEKDEHISDLYRSVLWEALEDAEHEATRPPEEPPDITGALMAVLDELRALRRLYEDDRQAREQLVDLLEALAPRPGSGR